MFTDFNDINSMFGAMDLLRQRMDSIFNSFDAPSRLHPAFWPRSNYPGTNLFDCGDHFEVQAEVPGLSKEDLTINIQGNYLEISGKQTVSLPEGYRVHRSERSDNSFTRSYTLPADVDANKVTATLKDGLLTLHLPKTETAKTRQITIN